MIVTWVSWPSGPVTVTVYSVFGSSPVYSMVHGLDSDPWSSPVEIVTECGSAGAAASVISAWSRVLRAVPSRLTEAISPVPGGTSPSGQLSCAVPLPSASVVKVTSVTSPPGPRTVTVYSVSGLRSV